ncbi:hypothetical protein ACF0H5_005994 [Mactra antiquata]
MTEKLLKAAYKRKPKNVGCLEELIYKLLLKVEFNSRVKNFDCLEELISINYATEKKTYPCVKMNAYESDILCCIGYLACSMLAILLFYRDAQVLNINFHSRTNR